ncbi:MAG: peptidoglycan DD-metalloendopeptidase family protein [Pseudomonadota bacterium]
MRAYEDGLAALRDGLRRVAIRQRALEDDLAEREAEIAGLLAALQRMEQSASPVLLLHPSGPLGTARAAMLLAEITPVLQRDADLLRADLTRLTDLRALEARTAVRLTDGLAGIRDARAGLSEAIAARGPLPSRLAADDGRLTDLLDRAETLDAFADGLGDLPDVIGAAVLTRPFPWPVDGTLLSRFREADAAGIERPGLVLATHGGALVTAPSGGTVRYAGPLLDYGNVIILEPEPQILMVLAGISELYAAAGEIVGAAAPLGLMGEALPEAGVTLRQPRAGGGASRSETLYIEVRQGGRPVDPATWFAMEQ